VLLQRKMKAEEEDVDIDTVVSHAASTERKSGSGSGSHSDNMGGGATPIGSSGNAHVGDIGAMSEVTMGDVGAIDIDVIWAEECPDDDLPGGWKMRVVMDNEAADYY
jgi:COMPASS component SWD1